MAQTGFWNRRHGDLREVDRTGILDAGEWSFHLDDFELYLIELGCAGRFAAKLVELQGDLNDYHHRTAFSGQWVLLRVGRWGAVFECLTHNTRPPVFGEHDQLVFAEACKVNGLYAYRDPERWGWVSDFGPWSYRDLKKEGAP